MCSAGSALPAQARYLHKLACRTSACTMANGQRAQLQMTLASGLACGFDIQDRPGTAHLANLGLNMMMCLFSSCVSVMLRAAASPGHNMAEQTFSMLRCMGSQSCMPSFGNLGDSVSPWLPAVNVLCSHLGDLALLE